MSQASAKADRVARGLSRLSVPHVLVGYEDAPGNRRIRVVFSQQRIVFGVVAVQPEGHSALYIRQS